MLIASSFLIPLIMLFFGLLFSKNIPKKINKLFGYRTSMSMANIDTWNYAHLYIGRLWIKFGIIELILCIFAVVICILLDDGKTDLISLILIIIQCILLMATIIITERKLKMVFDENGNRR